MKSKPTLILVLAILITVGSGFLHGHLNQRWGTDEHMVRVADQLKQVPETFGAWKLTSAQPLSSSAIDMLQCAGYLNGIYVNEQTGEQITAAVMVGPGSTMAIHTPEICYSAKNFTMIGSRRHLEVEFDDLPTQVFWAVDFQLNDITARELRVHYAWSDGGAWVAPEKPRLAFAGKRSLFKIQIAEYISPLQVSADDTIVRFLRDFVPVLKPKME